MKQGKRPTPCTACPAGSLCSSCETLAVTSEVKEVRPTACAPAALGRVLTTICDAGCRVQVMDWKRDRGAELATGSTRCPLMVSPSPCSQQLPHKPPPQPIQMAQLSLEAVQVAPNSPQARPQKPLRHCSMRTLPWPGHHGRARWGCHAGLPPAGSPHPLAG